MTDNVLADVTSKEDSPKVTPSPGINKRSHGKALRSLSISEVDTSLAQCEKTIKDATELVKGKLTSGGAIPTDTLRNLSNANKRKTQLTMRRIALLIETGDAGVMELIDKLCKLKPTKA